jgi:chromosome segregation protein
VEFENFAIRDADGSELSREEIASEERARQKDRQREVERLKIRLEEMGGEGSGEEILSEYEEATERDLFLEKELTDLKESSEKLRELITELEETVNEKFKAGISKINSEFEKFFALMFGGGKALLSIVKIQKRGQDPRTSQDVRASEEIEEEPPEEGVEISVSLPHKKIRGLEMLSGGERALTSIALIFAMSQVNPPPFIILDETDAALDEANSKRYGDMIEALAKDSQLILITHNRETMSRAGVLYGVTMGKDGASKLLSVEFEEAVEVAK